MTLTHPKRQRFFLSCVPKLPSFARGQPPRVIPQSTALHLSAMETAPGDPSLPLFSALRVCDPGLLWVARHIAASQARRCLGWTPNARDLALPVFRHLAQKNCIRREMFSELQLEVRRVGGPVGGGGGVAELPRSDRPIQAYVFSGCSLTS